MPEFPAARTRVKPVTAASPLRCQLSDKVVPVALEVEKDGATYLICPEVYEQLIRYGLPAPEPARTEG